MNGTQFCVPFSVVTAGSDSDCGSGSDSADSGSGSGYGSDSGSADSGSGYDSDCYSW